MRPFCSRCSRRDSVWPSASKVRTEVMGPGRPSIREGMGGRDWREARAPLPVGDLSRATLAGGPATTAAAFSGQSGEWMQARMLVLGPA